MIILNAVRSSREIAANAETNIFSLSRQISNILRAIKKLTRRE